MEMGTRLMLRYAWGIGEHGKNYPSAVRGFCLRISLSLFAGKGGEPPCRL
jgi:hypothetical protein